MKILQINKFHYRHGGTETVYFNTSELLKSKGHDVIHFSVKDNNNLTSPTDEYFINMPNLRKISIFKKMQYATKFLYNYQSAKNIEKLILKEKPDIAHIHLLFNGISISILPVLKKHNIPVVYSVHDYRLLCPASLLLNNSGEICHKCITGNYTNCTINKCSPGSSFNSLMLTFESYFRKYVIPFDKYISSYIFVSKFSKNLHESNLPNITNRSNLLYNFTLFSKQDINRGDYFLFIGRLSREKGLKTFLEASLKIKNKKFVVAGTGPLNDEINKTDYPNVEFIGFVTGDKLKNYIINSEYVVIPSEWYENNPLSVIEPLSMGKPVIGSEIGGIPELISDNKNGFLFRAFDSKDLERAIVYATSISDENYSALCSNAYKFYQSYNSEKYYNLLIDLYNKLIHHK